LLSPPHGRTRLQTDICKPKIYNNGTVRYGLLAPTGEPTSIDEALTDTNWHKAMEEEYDSLI
jgi:hypothetical protein